MEKRTEQLIGEVVPEFHLGPVDGTEFRQLASILEGRQGAVIVFWSGICSHCRRYDPYLQQFATHSPDLGLAVIASRERESVQDLEKCVADRALQFSVLHDSDRKVARAWMVNQTPRAFLIDAEGRLLYRGAIDNFKYSQDPDYEPYLDNAIEDFLAGRPVRRSETPGFGCPIESQYYRMPVP